MRQWKNYARYARDGEKFVWCNKKECQEPKVRIDEASISFKPSKLVWCHKCKATYYAQS